MAALNSLVSEAVDVVVHCARRDGCIQVTEVVAVEDLQGGPDATAFTVTPLFERDTPRTPLRWTGNLPARAARPLEMAGVDVRALFGAAPAAPRRRKPPA
jgi:pilus assembly protein CpaF